MRMENAPNRSQGREEEMQAASFLARCAAAVNENDGLSAAAQRARLLEALRTTSLTTLEARRLLDVLHPAARIMELRRQGYDIQTVRVPDLTAEGRAHNVARYILREGKAAE